MLNTLDDARRDAYAAGRAVSDRSPSSGVRAAVSHALRFLDPVCVFLSALVAVVLYLRWAAPSAAAGTGLDFEKVALLAAVVAPFALHDPAFGSTTRRDSMAGLAQTHGLRCALLAIAVFVLGHLGSLITDQPDALLVLWFAGGLVSTSATRVLIVTYLGALERRGELTEVIAIVGAGPAADRLATAMQLARSGSVTLLGVFDDSGPGAGKVPVTGTVDALLELGRTRRVDWILLAAAPTAERDLQALLSRLKSLSVPIAHCPEHFDLAPALRSGDCVDGSVSVSVVADRPADRIDRLRVAGEALLPRWLITLALLPLSVSRPALGSASESSAQRRARRAAVALTLAFDDYDVAGFGEAAANFGQDRFGYAVTPNADHIIRLHDEPAFRGAYASASFVLLDSQFLARVVRLSRGVRLPVCRGSDLTEHLFSSVVGADDRIVLVGGTVAQAESLASRYGTRGLVQFRPPMGFIRDANAVERCLEFIEAQSPFRFCLLAVGSPQQELLAQALEVRGKARGLALCVGASIDFLTGAERRAPVWLQRSGLEWSYRLAQSPRRLAGRYLVRGPRVFALMRTARVTLRPVADRRVGIRDAPAH